jgi:hypothetical protein
MFPPAAVSMRAVCLFWHNVFANIAVQKFLTRLYGCNFMLPLHA